METELWPNLAAAAARTAFRCCSSTRGCRNVPRAATDGSRRSRAPLFAIARRRRRANRRRRGAAAGARRARRRGHRQPQVRRRSAAGACASADAALRARFGAERPVLVVASTRDGEEALLLDALARAATLPAARSIVIVPRHPQRFDDVAALLAERGIPFVRRSSDAAGAARRAHRARRLDGRDARVLRCGRRRVRRRQPVAARRPEPDRADRRRRADADRSAHVQFRGGQRGGGRGRRGRAHSRCGRAARDRGRAPCRCAARERMRADARTFIAAHRGAVDRLWAWLAPRLRDASRRAAGVAEQARAR